MLLTGGRGRLAAATITAALAVAAALGGGSAGASDRVGSPAAALDAARAPIAELQPTRTIHFGDVTVTTYSQRVNGLPVLNGQVSVMSSPGQNPTVLGDGTSTVAAQAKSAVGSAEPIDAGRAIAIARDATGASKLRAKPTAALAVDPSSGAVVRRVELASGRPLKDLEVLVDAGSGRVLSVRNRLEHATATAAVYTPNPVADNGGYAGLGKGPHADHHDQDTAKLTSLRVPVSFVVNDAQDCLVGPEVEARVGKGKGSPVCDPSLDWSSVTRSDNRFEALEAYAEIDQVAGYYRSLGFTSANHSRRHGDFHPKPQTVVVDNFPDDNSFYSPFTRKIDYGSGGVDDAEDGDVVVHEYGHSIQAAQDPGFGSTDVAGALGEGFGDYQSALNLWLNRAAGYISLSHQQLAHQAKCIFDWDGTVGWGGPGVKPCGRLATGADGTKRYRQAHRTCARGAGAEEVHCLGEVWAHGLIDLLLHLPHVTHHGQSNVPPIAVDVIASQFTYADNESFAQAVNALVAADRHIFAGHHVKAICHEMKRRRGIHASACS
jgi:hypothetical protein